MKNPFDHLLSYLRPNTLEKINDALADAYREFYDEYRADTTDDDALLACANIVLVQRAIADHI